MEKPEKPLFVMAKLAAPDQVIEGLTANGVKVAHHNEFMHHMTLHFDKKGQPFPEFNLGGEVRLYIETIAEDDKGQAVGVESGLEVTNPHPHITVSTAEDVKPVYSNELFQDPTKVRKLEKPFWVDAVITLKSKTGKEYQSNEEWAKASGVSNEI